MSRPAAGADERKLVTVLFADVTGSTELGERLDPERVRALLETYFSTMSAVIGSWGGTVEKFIGDAIMAVFGVPVVREDDAQRALHAALEMLGRLSDLNEEFRERHGVTMQIRIGVNSGEAIVPDDRLSRQMLVAGDPVNVAARLEQSADPGTILVGERTYLAARGAFTFDAPVSLPLKGKAEPVSARRLLGVAGDQVRGVPGLRAPLVGRDRDLRAIVGLLEEAIETGRPRTVLLSGPAGIGKSRLVNEFVREAVASRPETIVLRGRCIATGHGVTYWALGEILRDICGISLDDPSNVAGDKLRRTIPELLEPLGLTEADRERTIHALAATAGLTLPDSPLEDLEPEAMAAELGRAWPRAATAVAARASTAIVVEDLHWAGEQLLEMLDRLASRSQGALLIVTTARPEFAESHASFIGREDVSTISLRPLTDGQSSELVDALLTAADLPDGLRQEILGKAEGNPFFVEEMLRRLIDEGGLVHEGGSWRITKAAGQVSLPDSVHSVLAARIDALPRVEKRVLQEAAVVGRTFWEEPVTRSAGNGAVGPTLLALEQKGLIFARPSSSIAGQAEYMFKHALVRDVAYGSLPKARRARAHAAVGDWIEQLAGDRVDEFAELVAYHYHSAVAGEDSDLGWVDDDEGRQRLRRKALDALVGAGAAARRRYAVDKAVELHEQALELATTDEERGRVLEELGDDHFTNYHGDEAISAYRGALGTVPPGTAGRGQRARLALKIGRTSGRWGAFRSKPDPSWVEEVIHRGLEEADEPETRVGLMILRGVAATFWSPADSPDPVPHAQRIAWGEEALAAAEQLGNVELVMRAGGILSELYAEDGRFQEAMRVNVRRLDLVDDLPSREAQADLFQGAAIDLLDTAGDAQRAYDLLTKSYAISRETSDHQMMHTTAELLRAAFWLGRWDEIPPILEHHLAAFAREADVTCPEVRGGPAFGAMYLAHTGQPERARQLANLISAEAQPPRLQRATTILLSRYWLAMGEPAFLLNKLDGLPRIAERWAERGTAEPRLEALVAVGDWERLRAFLPAARGLIDGDPLLGPMSDRAEGLALAAEGRRDDAARLLRQAVDGFEQFKFPFEVARTQEMLAEVAEPGEAAALRASALATYEQLGAEPHAARVRAAIRGSTGGRDPLAASPN